MAKKTAAKSQTTVSDQLRAAIKGSDMTMYRIATDLGMNPTTVARFLDGGELKSSNFDKMCNLLGLELRPKRK